MKVTITIRPFQKNVYINQMKNNHNYFFHGIIMLRFGEAKIAKEKFYAGKRAVKIQDVNDDSIVISILVKRNTNSNYLVRYLGKTIGFANA